MKRWLIIVVLLLASLLPARAQEPGGMWLPLILKGADEMACQPFQILEITDGTTTVNLLSPKSGFCLLDWQPAVTEPKGGGVWRDSQLADGRTPVHFARGNVVETYLLAVRDWTPDDLIRDTQDLRRLLEKARAYSMDKYQDEPVWVKRQGMIEAAPTYAIVKDYRTPQDGNPHGSDAFWTALGTSAFDSFTLIIEREPWWRGDEPGTGTCVETSGQQEEWDYIGWTVNTNQPGGAVRHILELQSTANRMLAAEQNQEIWRTDTGGAVWTAAAAAPTMDCIWMAEDVSNARIYVVGSGGCWRSINGGVNWVQMNAAVRAASFNSLIFASDNYLYLADHTNFVVQRSNDQGATWVTVLSTGVRPRCVFEASDGYIYVGDAMGRIFRSPNGTTWAMFQWPKGYGDVYGFWEPGDDYLYTVVSTATGFELYRKSVANTIELFAYVAEVDTVGTPFTLILASDGYYYVILSNGVIKRSVDTISWQQVTDIGNNASSVLEYSGNSRLYAGEDLDIWWSPVDFVTVGRAATCEDEVFISNSQNIAQFTHIWEFEAGVGWTNHFPSGAFPFNLLPNPMATGDAIVLTIDTSLVDTGPFDNAVFDISRGAVGDFSITWYYPSGAAAFPPPGAGWTALNLYDGTHSFQMEGVQSLHFVPFSNWTQVTINLITGYHIVGLVTVNAGLPVGPQQDNRDVYTVNWPRVDVDEAQVLGDIPALLQIKLRNRSDEDGYDTVDELDLLENRVVVGLRSLARGPTFTAYLNCSDEQNPPGVTAANGAATLDVDDMDHPTGRCMRHTTTGASAWTDECTFTLGPTIARDFYGSFHAYFRGKQVNRSAVMDEVRVRLQVRTGSGGVTFTTEHRPFRNLNDWQLLDFGGLDLPASGLLSADDLPDEMEIAVQVWSSVAALTVHLYDLALIPTDEWAGDFVDKALEDDSGVTNGYFLDVDSVTYPKRDIRALVRQVGNDRVRSAYQPNGPSPASLRENADQRLWFLAARGCVLGAHTGANNQPILTDVNASFLTSGVAAGQYVYNVNDGVWGIITAVTATTVTATTLAGAAFDWDTNEEYLIICPNWRSEPWNCHSVQLVNVVRYLSMKGAR